MLDDDADYNGDDEDDDDDGVEIVAKSQRHQELRRSALCTSCNLQEVSAHKQQQVQLNLQLYPPDATDITVNTKVKINNNNNFIDITMHGKTQIHNNPLNTWFLLLLHAFIAASRSIKICSANKCNSISNSILLIDASLSTFKLW